MNNRKTDNRKSLKCGVVVRSLNFGTSTMIIHEKKSNLGIPQWTSQLSFPSINSGATSETIGGDGILDRINLREHAICH